MPDKFTAPFTISNNEDAYFVTDAEGAKFAFVYYWLQPIVGTDRSVRVSKRLAERTVKWIARAMNEAAGTKA